MNQHFGLFLKDKLLSLGLGEASRFEGCSATEIEEIKAAQGVKCLPSKYVEFLEVMGKGAGGRFLRGNDYRYSQLLTLKRISQGIINGLAEEEPGLAFEIPPDAFVFLGQQGVYIFYFLTTDCDDDPPTYLWAEGEGQPQKRTDHFSELFINTIQQLTENDRRPRK